MSRQEKNAKKKENQISASAARFSRALQDMIATNIDSYNTVGSSLRARDFTRYTKEQALQIIHNGNPNELRQLSIDFFYTSGFYRMMILYFATLLDYTTLIVPRVKEGQKITSQITNTYNKAIDYADNLGIEDTFTHFALVALMEGAYYGLICHSSEGLENIVDLPFEYCRSRFKTYAGTDIIEFNLSYFDKIRDSKKRIQCLKSYPDEIRKAYNKYKNSGASKWYLVPSEDSIHFMFIEERPLFCDIIPAVIDFGDYRELEKDRDTQDLYKILVQEMPHTADGELVFEPEEVAPMHKGIANMLRGRRGVDVVTSFGTVKVADMQSARSSVVTNNLDKISSSIYNEAGFSQELFAAENSTSLTKSIQKDTGIAMFMARQFCNWLEYILDVRFGKDNNTLKFAVKLLPITQYNREDMAKIAYQGTQYGYSILLPYLCMGIKQSEVRDLKVLENDILKLQKIMVPLESANTRAAAQTSQEGRQKAEESGKEMDNEKPDGQKADQTVRNIESGGGSSE